MVGAIVWHMTKIKWLNKVKENADILRDLIGIYHPINLPPHKDTEEIASHITAPNAERACETVRNLIRQESMERPDIQFNIALQKEDCDTISSLLSSAWFGVPESTSCWDIRGFAVACDLLDDPIEEDFQEPA